jgi:hypothetical protein
VSHVFGSVDCHFAPGNPVGYVHETKCGNCIFTKRAPDFLCHVCTNATVADQGLIPHWHGIIGTTFCGNKAHCLFIHKHFLAPPQAASPAMQLFLVNVFACIATCFFYLLIVFRDHRRRRGLPYPPGPSSLPIIGNLLDFPTDMPWRAYAEMSKKYGMCNILEN